MWGGAFTPTSPFELPKKLHLFMLRGPRIKNIAKLFIGVPSVRNGQCEALPLTATPKRVTKRAFMYAKRAKAKKTVSYRTLGLAEYGMTNASNVKRGFTTDSNPKGVI